MRYEDGMRAFNKEDYKTALEIFENLNIAENTLTGTTSEGQRLSVAFCRAFIYQNGYSVEKDNDRAIKLYEEVNDGRIHEYINIIPDVRTLLGECYWARNEGKDYELATGYFLSMAGEGCHKAQFLLGNIQFEKDNFEQAFGWWKKAADKGDEDSQNSLGRLYRYGKGAILDYPEAYKWFNLAASKGSDEAVKNRDEITKIMTSSQLEEAQKLSREWKKIWE